MNLRQSSGVLLMALTWILLMQTSADAHNKWLEAEPTFSSKPTSAKLYLATGEALRQVELLPERRPQRILSFQLRKEPECKTSRPCSAKISSPLL